MQARVRSTARRSAAHLRASATPDLVEAVPAAAPCGCRSAPTSPGNGRGSANAAAAWGLPTPPANPAWSPPAATATCLPAMAAVLAAPPDSGSPAMATLRQGGGAVPSGLDGVEREHDLRAVEAELRTVLNQFPAVRHAFAYGSGVFEQPGLYAAAAGGGGGNSAVARPMLDFIFAVDSPIDWHHEVRAC